MRQLAWDERSAGFSAIFTVASPWLNTAALQFPQPLNWQRPFTRGLAVSDRSPTRTQHTMKFSKTVSILSATVLSLSLAACGGGDATDGPVGGNVTGLASGTSVTLQNNGADTLTVSSNTSFTFATRIANLQSFNVTVLTQPVPQACMVTRGTGVIPTDGSTVNTVAVSCALSSVGGTLSGLAAGASVTFSVVGTQATSTEQVTTPLVVAQNGTFYLPVVLTAGTTYAVSVTTQPTGQTCTVGNAGGTAIADVTGQVTVSCV